MKLTAGRISGLDLPPGKTDHLEWDDDVPGFGVRLRKGGSRSFVFQYKIGDKHRRLNLGAVSAIPFGEARKTVEKLYARVKLGEDPAGDKAETKIKAAETFEAVSGRFLEHQRGRLRPSSYEDVERHILTYAKPLHGLGLAKIQRRDIAAVLMAVAKNSGATTSNRTRSSLSTLFSWAMMNGLIESNPVIGTGRNKEISRDRVLNHVELKTIWEALEDDHFGAIMKLLALTGQREDEIAALRWSEIHDGMIMLPKERTKNHRPHTVPLSAPARAILAAQPHRTNAAGRPRDIIFGTGEGGFSGWSQATAALEARITEKHGAPLPHWTPHDLRRTAATGMADIGIQPHVIEAVLNHASGHKSGVAGIYNRASYEREKAQALDRWADQLLAIVRGRKSKVVALRR